MSHPCNKPNRLSHNSIAFWKHLEHVYPVRQRHSAPNNVWLLEKNEPLLSVRNPEFCIDSVGLGQPCNPAPPPDDVTVAALLCWPDVDTVGLWFMNGDCVDIGYGGCVNGFGDVPKLLALPELVKNPFGLLLFAPDKLSFQSSSNLICWLNWS